MKRKLSMKLLYILASRWAQEKATLVTTGKEDIELMIKYRTIMSFLKYVWIHKNDKF